MKYNVDWEHARRCLYCGDIAFRVSDDYACCRKCNSKLIRRIGREFGNDENITLRIIINNCTYSIDFELSAFESGLKDAWEEIVDSFSKDEMFYAEKEDELELLVAQKNAYMPFKEFAPYKRSMLKNMRYRNIHFFRKSWHCVEYEERGIREQVIDKREIGHMRIHCDDTKMVRMLFEWFVSTTPSAGANGGGVFHLRMNEMKYFFNRSCLS